MPERPGGRIGGDVAVYTGQDPDAISGLYDRFNAVGKVYDLTPELQQLLALDFTTPTVQQFPSSASGFFSLTGITPKHIWLCDESSGGLVDEVLGKTLTPSNSPLQGRTAVGFFDGTDCFNKSCVEGTSFANQKFSDTTSGLSLTDSVAILVIFRAGALPASTYSIAGWFGGLFELQMLVTGVLRARSGASIIGLSNGGDGAWHYAVYGKNVTADEWRLRSDLGTGTAANPGDFTDGNSGIFAAQSGVSAPVQVAYVATFEGSSAEAALAAGGLDSFWNHAKQTGTGGLNPQLSTYIRDTLACPEIGSEAGFGIRVTKYGSGSFAHGYRSTFTHATQLGLVSEVAATNVVTGSEDFTQHLLYGADVISYDNEAPDGTWTASRFSASLPNAYVAFTGSTTSGSTAGSFYLSASNGVTGKVVLMNVGAGTTGSYTSFTGSDLWVRVTGSGELGTNSQLRLQLDLSGTQCLGWGVDMEVGPWSTTYIPTTTAAATRDKTEMSLLNPGGNTYFKSISGEVEVTFSLYADDVNNNQTILLEGRDVASGLADAFLIRHKIGKFLAAIIRDSGGTIVSNRSYGATWSDMRDENVLRLRFDSVNTITDKAVNTDAYKNGDYAAGEVATWDAGTGATELGIAQTAGRTAQIGGVVAYLNIWNKPRPNVV